MKYLTLLFSCLWCCSAFGQTLKELDGRWAFTGLRTTVLKVEEEKLYVGMLQYADTSNFNRFLRKEPLDLILFSPASFRLSADTLIIESDFPKIDHQLKLLYTTKNNDYIFYTGDVFFDSLRAIIPNSNCNIAVPACDNRLYRKNDIDAIMKLKSAASFSRDDAFEFLLRLNKKLARKCNKCYAGFTDAYMNEVLIEMGFNPITRHNSNQSAWYNTSGFSYFIKAKFKEDERVLKLTEQVFDWYIRNY